VWSFDHEDVAHRVLVRATARDAAQPLLAQVVTGSDALGALDKRWDALLDRQHVPVPVQSSTWLREALRVASGHPLVVVVLAGERLVAGGAFSSKSAAIRYGPVLAGWPGSDFAGFSPDVLTDPEVPEATDVLIRALFEEVAAVHLGYNPIAGSFGESLRARAPWMRVIPDRLVGWRLQLPPPKLDHARQRVEHVLRRAARRGTRVSVAVAREPEAVAAALERLFALCRERWDGRLNEIPRFSSSEAQRSWHRRAVAGLAVQDRVRIVEVLEDGEPVSSQLNLLFGRGALFHTTATRIGGRLHGPGHVAMLASVEAAMAAGAEVMDLGCGSGEPGGPKFRIGATMVPLASFAAASSQRWQRPLEGALWLRKSARHVRSRRGRSAE
jgi:hypothetical protein